MKIASISDAKNKLSYYLDLVRQGDTVVIVDRKTPVARLESILSRGRGMAKGRLERLERKGLISRGHRTLDKKILLPSPPKAKKGADILQILLAEREKSY